MAIRLAAGPIGWFEDDFSAFRNDIAREAHLTSVARAHFDGICLNPGSAREVACVHAVLARHRLSFVAPSHKIALVKQTAEQVFVTLQAHVHAALALGATELTVCETHAGDMTEADWQRFAERLDGLAGLFYATKVRLVLRPCADTIISSAPAIDRAMTMTSKNVCLMLDDRLLGADAITLAARYAERIAIVAVDRFSDEILAALPDYSGWTVLDQHAGHAPVRVSHLHQVCDQPIAA